MQVILFQTVEQLGLQGSVVNVAAGYYRNYLGPMGFAIEATEGNLRQSEMKRKRLQADAEKQVQDAQVQAHRLAEAKIEFTEKANPEGRLFGAIHDRELMDALNEQGFKIERRQILMKEPIKAIGNYSVRIRLIQGVDASVAVSVKPDASSVQAEEKEAAPAAAEAPAAPEGESAE